MRLHENKEGDELQRLRPAAREQEETIKTVQDRQKLSSIHMTRIITKKKITTMNMRKNRIRTDWKFLLKTTTAAVQVFLTDIANIATKAGEKEKPATVIAHLELQEMWKLLHHQAKRVKPAETILVKHPESGKRQNGQLFF